MCPGGPLELSLESQWRRTTSYSASGQPRRRATSTIRSNRQKCTTAAVISVAASDVVFRVGVAAQVLAVQRRQVAVCALDSNLVPVLQHLAHTKDYIEGP